MSQSFDAWTQLALVVDSTNTTAVTVGSGPNRALLVWTLTGSASDILTSVTYNGVTMSLLTSGQEPVTGNWSFLHGLLNPDSGTHDVVQTLSGSVVLYGHAASYAGVSAFHNAVVTTNASTDSFTATTTTSANDWVAGALRSENLSGESSVYTSRSGNPSTATSGIWLDSNGQVAAGTSDLAASQSIPEPWIGLTVALQAPGGKFILIPGR